MKVLCLKVELKNAQAALGLAKSKFALSFEFKPQKTKDQKHLLIPLTRKITVNFAHSFEKIELTSERKPKDLKTALTRSGFDSEELELVNRSFEHLGNIAIIEVPAKLRKKEKLIAKCVLEVNPSISTILKKESAMTGKYRVRKFKHLAGKKTTIATYKENNTIIRVDLAKVYYSTRLAFERNRIAAATKPKELVIVFFAGCGPFALAIAKAQPKAKVIGIELNKTACKYFRENVKLNKLENCEVIQGDVHKLAQKYKKKATRIVMPLPHTASEFLQDALTVAANGAVIHYYSFGPFRDLDGEKLDPFEEQIKLVNEECSKAKHKCKIVEKRIARPYSPTEVQVALDVKVV